MLAVDGRKRPADHLMESKSDDGRLRGASLFLTSLFVWPWKHWNAVATKVLVNARPSSIKIATTAFSELGDRYEAEGRWFVFPVDKASSDGTVRAFLVIRGDGVRSVYERARRERAYQLF